MFRFALLFLALGSFYAHGARLTIDIPGYKSDPIGTVAKGSIAFMSTVNPNDEFETLEEHGIQVGFKAESYRVYCKIPKSIIEKDLQISLGEFSNIVSRGFMMGTQFNDLTEFLKRSFKTIVDTISFGRVQFSETLPNNKRVLSLMCQTEEGKVEAVDSLKIEAVATGIRYRHFVIGEGVDLAPRLAYTSAIRGYKKPLETQPETELVDADDE